MKNSDVIIKRRLRQNNFQCSKYCYRKALENVPPYSLYNIVTRKSDPKSVTDKDSIEIAPKLQTPQKLIFGSVQIFQESFDRVCVRKFFFLEVSEVFREVGENFRSLYYCDDKLEIGDQLRETSRLSLHLLHEL